MNRNMVMTFKKITTQNSKGWNLFELFKIIKVFTKILMFTVTNEELGGLPLSVALIFRNILKKKTEIWLKNWNIIKMYAL